MKQKFSKNDIFFVTSIPSQLLAYLILVICLEWDLDGPYWIIEDFGTDQNHRSNWQTMGYFLVRTFLLTIGFVETCRSIHYACLGYYTVLLSLIDILDVLKLRVNNTQKFFKFYTELSIISRFLCDVLGNANFTSVTIFYYMFIQTNWICICGIEGLNPFVYSFFALFGLIITYAASIYLPLVVYIAENIVEVPRARRIAMKRRYIGFRTFENRINCKIADALIPLKFSYGGHCPLGKSFARNCFNNGLQTLCSMVLLFDLHGRRHQ